MVGKSSLGIFVQVLHVRMGWSTIKIKIILLDILPVVALRISQAKHSFLQNGIFPVPQGKRKTDPLVIIRDSGDAILTPAVSPRSRLVVAKIVPGIPVLAVIFPDGAPLALAEIGTPFLPRDLLFARLLQAEFFLGDLHLLISIEYYSSFRQDRTKNELIPAVQSRV